MHGTTSLFMPTSESKHSIFYLVLITFASGGMLTIIKDGTYPWVIAVIAFLLIFLSGIFWKLDCRNKQLVRSTGEAALKRLEQESAFEDKTLNHMYSKFLQGKSMKPTS